MASWERARCVSVTCNLAISLSTPSGMAFCWTGFGSPLRNARKSRDRSRPSSPSSSLVGFGRSFSRKVWATDDMVFLIVWYMVYGIWYMAYGIWYILGIWSMVYGTWYMVYDRHSAYVTYFCIESMFSIYRIHHIYHTNWYRRYAIGHKYRIYYISYISYISHTSYISYIHEYPTYRI